MDPLSAIGLVANILEFGVIVKILLMLIRYLRHRTKLPDEESAREAADPPSLTKLLEVPESRELVLQQTHLHTIQYPISERLVFFRDAVRRQHIVPLYALGTTEVLDKFHPDNWSSY
jgi:hypothetical protein